MFKKILVPTDGSDLSARAMDGAVSMAKQLGSRLVGITVIEPYSYSTVSEYRPESVDDYEQRAQATGEARLEPLRRRVAEAGLELDSAVMRAYSPYEAIIEAAARYECDVIFMASHGRRGLSAVLLGSETQKVLTHSRVPVLVFR